MAFRKDGRKGLRNLGLILYSKVDKEKVGSLLIMNPLGDSPCPSFRMKH